MNLFDKLKINQKYIYSGQLDELEKKLITMESLIVERIAHNKFELRPTLSLGVLMIKGVPNAFAGIKVNVTIAEQGQSEQQVHFTTGIRIEHFFIIVMFLFFLIAFVFSKHESVLPIIFIIGLWILSHLWFHLVYRVQEETVIEMAVNGLKLRTV